MCNELLRFVEGQPIIMVNVTSLDELRSEVERRVDLDFRECRAVERLLERLELDVSKAGSDQLDDCEDRTLMRLE
jgi:hypothetical protein